MSVAMEIICKNCRVEFDFDNLAIKRDGNEAMEAYLHEATNNVHVGHDLIHWSSDHQDIGKDGHLRVSHLWVEPEIIVENFADYGWVNLATGEQHAPKELTK